MIVEINNNHKIDHRKSDAIYETLRKSYFPVVRENTRLPFQHHVKCPQCLAAVDLPKTQITRKPIPATYSNRRVERFNRTVVAYFRAQFVDTRDWPSLLGEFYYKYNNRVNKSTRPMTHHQRFFKSPNFSMASEEQINSKGVHKKAQEIARIYAESDYQEFVESLWNTRITNMINESESVIARNETITSNVHYMQPENDVENVAVNTVQTSNRSNEMIPSQQQLQMSQPLQDVTNSQMMRNTSLHQSEVSPYYKDLYARRFIQHTDSGMPGFKRRHLETEIYMSESREEWDSSMYPEELFPKKVSKITEMQTFHPAVNKIIDFKPNSALSAGTNVFLSGYWKKGLVINIENDDSEGKVYTIKELENSKIHQV
ncbi:unnamed protein product [Mytilus coruscus]|uniref:Integrase catalytic domain-containing protein n=1 Tax=Mytilus coruscus TaxID=42192 RepID=A0A6J8DWH8_MYTCO|nr:unnamed protein product [Mytilus coruscus]